MLPRVVRHLRPRRLFRCRRTSSPFTSPHTMRSFSCAIDPSINLSDDQKEYQSLAMQFMENELKPNAFKWDQEHQFDRGMMVKAAELGFGGLYTSSDFGGMEMSRLDTAIIFEALAQGCVSTTSMLTIHNMCCWMVDSFASNELKEQYLPRMTSCELIGSYCLTEPHCGSDAAALKTKAVREGDEYIVSGTKQFISGGGMSDVYVVMVRTGDDSPNGISTLLIPKDSPGLSFGAQEKKMGWCAQPTSAVFMDNVRVPVQNRLGDEGFGFKIAMMGLDGGRINIAACSMGGAQRCLEEAIAYADGRSAFGKPLHAQQSLAFRLADMGTDVTASRLMLRNAAALFDEGHPEKSMYCAMAKRFVTDSGFKVCNEALQVLGGYGYLSEYEVERFVRDLRVHQILEGTNEIMKVVVARSLIKHFQENM